MSRYNLFVKLSDIIEGMDRSVYDPSEKQSQILVENDTLNDLTVASTWRPVSSNVVRDVDARVSLLEESLYEFEVYTSVASGTSGTVPVYAESEIRQGQYVDGQDCLVVSMDTNGRPVDRPARTVSGTAITATLGIDGSYTLSGTPTAYPVAIIYQLIVPSQYISNVPLDAIVNETQIDINDFYTGAGCITTPVYADNGDGTLTVEDVNAALFKFPKGQGKIRRFYIAGNVFTIPDNEVSYIVANYNNGSPQLQITQDVEIINETTIIPVLTVARFRGIIHTLNWDSLGRAKVDKIHQSIVKTARFRHQNGLNVGTKTGRYITGDSGRLWVGSVQYALNSFDSSLAGSTFNFVYHQGGTWVYSEQSQFNNTQYDDGSNLQTLSASRYAVNWVYRCVDDGACFYVLLGGGNYKLQEAQGSTEPAAPYEITSHSILLGRIIVEYGSDTPIEITSAFETQYSGGAVRSHTDLIDRSLANAHPSTAISYDGAYANVNLALDEAINNRAVDLQRDVGGLDYTLMEWWNQTQSAGRVFGGIITENIDGTVSITEGAGIVKTGTGLVGVDCTCDPNGPQISQNKYITWPAVANLNLFDEAYNYIYVDGADNTIKVTTDFYSIDYYNAFTIGRAYRSGTNVLARLCGTNLWNFNRRIQLFGEERFPVERAFGLIIGDGGTRQITCTEGVLWAELVNRFTIPGKSAAQEFTYWYRDGVGGWTNMQSTQISNTEYDDGSGTLSLFSAGPNQWRTDWVYVTHDGTYHVLFGQEEHASLTEAQSAGYLANIPGIISAYGSLLGRVIIQKNTDVLYITSSFDFAFAAQPIQNHNDLANRSAPDAHPISAITGLQAELDSKADYADMVGGATYNLT